MLFCPFIGDVYFDQLVNIVSARFHHCKVSMFTLELIHNLWGETLRIYINILFLVKYSPSFSAR